MKHTLAFLVAANFALVAFRKCGIRKRAGAYGRSVHRGWRVPAINLANAAADGAPAKRDAILAAVSQAQAVAGDRRARCNRLRKSATIGCSVIR